MRDYEEEVLNIMDNAKEDIKTQLDKAYKSGYEDGKKENCDCKDNMETEYNRGLNDAWEVVQNITKEEDKGGYSVEMLKDIFGYLYRYDIFQRYAPQDVIRMIKEYEEEQKQDAEIKEREWIGTDTFGTTISDEVYVTFEMPNGERFTDHLSFQNGKLPNFKQSEIDAWHKGAKPIAWMPLPESYKG